MNALIVRRGVNGLMAASFVRAPLDASLALRYSLFKGIPEERITHFELRPQLDSHTEWLQKDRGDSIACGGRFQLCGFALFGAKGTTRNVGEVDNKSANRHENLESR